MIEHIKWTERATLSLLDQRKLPREISYVECCSAEDVADAIGSMVVRGAPAIGIAAAYGLAMAGDDALHADENLRTFQNHLKEAASNLRKSRPTAVNLAWAVDLVHRDATVAIDRVSPAHQPGALVASWRASAQRLWDDDAERCVAIGRYGADIVPRPASILTICNTGMLATGGIGTAFGVIRTAFERGEVQHVYACETRPLCQGARLTSWELARNGIPGSVLVDSAAATVLSTGRVNFVIAGADRIAANGDTANKIGTLGLANLAKSYDVPFYVAAPLSTVDPQCETGTEIPIEERDPAEIARIAVGVGGYNPAFDVTPAHLIHGIVTEVGVLRPPFGDAIRRAANG